jgi:hypothetical protein
MHGNEKFNNKIRINLYLLQDPDSIKTGTIGRVAASDPLICGILTGVDLVLAPTSIDSESICANE